MLSSYFQERALRQFAWLAIAVLTLSYLIIGMVIRPATVNAAQLTPRSIAMSTSEEGVTATYTITFTVPDTGTQDIGSFRIEFCNNDPLPNETCTFTSGDNVPDLDAATLDSATFDDTGGTDECATLSLTAVTAGDRHLDITCNVVDDISGDGNFTATVSGIVNPTNATESPNNPNNSFYARLYVYNTTTPTAIANPVTGDIHDGGVALSTAEQLTITARVQEILEFCVGTTDPAPADCSAMSGNSVDLGVIDFADVYSAITDELNQGSVMVRTNASTGVVIEYFAEQDNGDGKLKIAGTACTDNVSETDGCINSAGATQTVVAASAEMFGLCVDSIDLTSSTGTATSNLDVAIAAPNYDGGGDCELNGVAFVDDGSADTIASSVGNGGVVNDEMLNLDFVATADLLTPSGLYTVTLTFIGTATF